MRHEDNSQQLQDDEYWFPYHHVAQYRDGFTQCFNDTWGINYVATIEHVLNQIDRETFSSMIDVGCGDGRFTKELQERHPKKRIVGVDISDRAISLAKAMVRNVEFKCIDIRTRDLGENFDLAVLMEVYEHVHPDEAPDFVGALADLLRPKGVLYLTVPHINKLLEYKHYRHFCSKSVIAEFSDRFEATSVVYIEKQSGLKRFIDFMLTNKLFVLNNRIISGKLYSFYKKHLFYAKEENECQRFITRFVKRS